MAKTSSDLDSQLKDLVSRLEGLVETARKQGREDALAEVRQLVTSGAAAAARPARATKAKAAKPAAKAKRKSGKPRKNPWADLSPEDRLARINAIRKGRGLPPRDSL